MLQRCEKKIGKKGDTFQYDHEHGEKTKQTARRICIVYVSNIVLEANRHFQLAKSVCKNYSINHKHKVNQTVVWDHLHTAGFKKFLGAIRIDAKEPLGPN